MNETEDLIPSDVVALVHRNLAAIANRQDSHALPRLTDGSTYRMKADEFIAQLDAATLRLKGANERMRQIRK